MRRYTAWRATCTVRLWPGMMLGCRHQSLKIRSLARYLPDKSRTCFFSLGATYSAEGLFSICSQSLGDRSPGRHFPDMTKTGAAVFFSDLGAICSIEGLLSRWLRQIDACPQAAAGLSSDLLRLFRHCYITLHLINAQECVSSREIP